MNFRGELESGATLSGLAHISPWVRRFVKVLDYAAERSGFVCGVKRGLKFVNLLAAAAFVLNVELLSFLECQTNSFTFCRRRYLLKC